ncbi:uncharacterized protein ARB_04630 [Trichophyton benhamiae CBS 112371]|uniref:Uncharacterized protein n=1 Tax=Arthroderma benhamiae (strain ATCC MYA-4681 / CBS 112371) TaxID=663331 RepID=D4AK29_ARTBC|nr:uncharacterized protein ARB_04630 [Trichophyton benhamiae CBS 112371]EFE37102.1 hypothetical protein ARB_04630 [Trichophyton benhamiae CBS 112371]
MAAYMDATSQRLKRVGREGKADLVQAEEQGELVVVMVVVVAAAVGGRAMMVVVVGRGRSQGPGAEPELSQRQQSEVTQEILAREEETPGESSTEERGRREVKQRATRTAGPESLWRPRSEQLDRDTRRRGWERWERRGRREEYTYHVEGEGGIELDEAVEVAEEDGDGQQQEVGRVADVVAQQLDELADEHPQQQRVEGPRPLLGVPGLGALVAEGQQAEVADEGGRRERRQEDRIRAPRLAAAEIQTQTHRERQKDGQRRDLQPDDLLLDEGGEVAAPVAAGPADALLEELRVVLERRLDLGLRVVLEVGLPAVGDHPAREEVVVVGVELVAAEPPLLVGEAQGELAVLQDLGAVRNGPSRQARHPAVHVRRGGAVEVAALEIQGAQEVPRPLHREQRRADPPQALAGGDAAVDGVLVERRQDPFELRPGPAHVVVHEDGDLGPHLRDCAHHLPPLVGLGDAQQLDPRPRGRHRRQHALRVGPVGVDGHQEDLVGLVQQDGPDGLLELLAAAGQGRDDDGYILGRQLGILRRRDRSKRPDGKQVDHQSQVPVHTIKHTRTHTDPSRSDAKCPQESRKKKKRKGKQLTITA